MPSNLPRATATVLQNGLGVTRIAPNTPLFMGVATGGTAAANTIVTIGNPSQARTVLGYGPLTEAVARTLAVAGGPVKALVMTGSVAAANSTVTQSGAGPLPTLAGTPKHDLQVKVKITLGGALGVGKFRYSLDNGNNYSEERTIPSGGSFSPLFSAGNNIGTTITFIAGTYVVDEVYSFTTTAAMWNATNLNTAIDAVKASDEYADFLVLCGHPADAAASAVLFAALDTHLTTLRQAPYYRFLRAIMSAGNESATAIATAFSGVDSVEGRILLAARGAHIPSAIPCEGYALPLVPLVNDYAARATTAVLSENLGRVKSGPFPGTTSVEHDERLNEALNQHRVATAYKGNGGVYATEGKLKHVPGSDFQVWERGRVMDSACTGVINVLQANVNEDFPTKEGGALSDDGAADLKAECDLALFNRLLSPTNAKGKKGHVSAAAVTIDQTNNFLSDETVNVNIAIRPRGRARVLNLTIGYTRGSVDGPDETQEEAA